MSTTSHETAVYSDNDETIGDIMVEVVRLESLIAGYKTQQEVTTEAYERGAISIEQARRAFDDLDQLQFITEYSRKQKIEQLNPSEPLRRKISRTVFRR